MCIGIIIFNNVDFVDFVILVLLVWILKCKMLISVVWYLLVK